MRVCKGCNHEVSSDMRYCLMRNVCPSCGDALFKDSEVQRISLIKSKILGQGFAQEFSEEDVFDISIFILSEFSHEDTVYKEEVGADNPNSDNASLEDIRAEVVSELGSEALSELDNNDDDDVLSELEDEELRIARLKRIAKETPALKKGGAVVRRVR